MISFNYGKGDKKRVKQGVFYGILYVVLPLAWIFARFANASFMIWWAFPIAEFVALMVAAYLLLRANKNIIKPMTARWSKDLDS